MNYISEDDLKQMNKWVDEWNLLERNRISPSTIIIFNASKVGAAARYEIPDEIATDIDDHLALTYHRYHMGELSIKEEEG